MITIVRSMVLVVLVGVVAAVGAGPVRKAADRARDQSQTMQARRLLLAEPELAAFNIGVIVQDRIAILWGPVPSAEIAFRAELCVRTMVELAEVRNELVVNDLLEPIRRPFKMEAPAAPRLPELLPPILPKDARSAPGSPGVLTGKDGGAKAPDARTAGHAKKADARPTDSTRAEGTETDLATAIRALLQRTPAYSPVQFATAGGRVYLRSREINQADILQDAARAIARLPGVKGVVVLEDEKDARD